MPAMDVMEEGRMGMLQDPEGAIVGIWQPKKHQGFEYKEVHGSPCWFEHGSHDSSKSVPFLEKVFGWTSKSEKMGGNLYTSFFSGEEMVGGLYIFSPDMSSVPSHWLPYFTIDNIETAIELTTKMGGSVLMPKMLVEGVGHFCVLRDPQGAVFGLVQG